MANFPIRNRTIPSVRDSYRVNLSIYCIRDIAKLVYIEELYGFKQNLGACTVTSSFGEESHVSSAKISLCIVRALLAGFDVINI